MIGQWFHVASQWFFFQPVTLHPVGIFALWTFAVEVERWRLRRKAKGGQR